MTRRFTLALALALLAAPVVASTLGGELDSLEEHLAYRISEIGAEPTDGKLKREAKKLQSARDILDTYVGNNDLPDLKILGRVGTQILSSKTADADIWEDVHNVVQALIDMAREKRGLGQDVLDRLYDEKYRKQVQKLLDKGDQHLDKAVELLRDLPLKAHKSVMKAWKQYLKSVVKGEKLELKADAAQPDHLFIVQSMFSLAIYNQSNKDHYIRDVLFTGEWRDGDGAVVATVDRASIAAVWPQEFEITVIGSGANTGWDCPCMISRTDAGAPTQYEDLWTYFYEYKARAMPGSGSCAFFGDIVVVVRNHHTSGTTYRIPFTPGPRYFD